LHVIILCDDALDCLKELNLEAEALITIYAVVPYPIIGPVNQQANMVTRPTFPEHYTRESTHDIPSLPLLTLSGQVPSYTRREARPIPQKYYPET
jgi:hypothetical protein